MQSLSQEDCYLKFVAMPWDDKKEIIFTEGNITKTCTKWELIQSQMDLLNPISSFTDLINVIKSYNVIQDKNGRQIPPPWKCLVLQKYFQNLGSSELKNFFCENGILSTIRNLVLRLKELVPSLELLKKGTCKTVTLHQIQIASLLANAFMCTFPKGKNVCPSINFNTLYESSSISVLNYNVEKIKCIVNYFWRIHRKQPTGNVSYHRLCIPDHKFPRWDQTSAELSSLIVDSNGKIEDQDGFLQVDFANKFIGGGILGRGCVQEEIRFTICPELIIARLFTESLGDNESLLIVGAERFCNYSGYSSTFKFTGDYTDSTPFDETFHKKSYITAVDAMCFHNFSDQFRESKILRELKKAYVGFKPFRELDSLPLATGNWGCGAFGGDPQLKSLLQLMASSQAGRNVLYLTFGDVVLKRQLEQLYKMLRSNSINVGMLYRIIRLYHREKKSNQSVFEFVKEAIDKIKKKRSFMSLRQKSYSCSNHEQNVVTSECKYSKGNSTFDMENQASCDENILAQEGNDDALFPEREMNFDGLEEEITNQSNDLSTEHFSFVKNSESDSKSNKEKKFNRLWFENKTDLMSTENGEKNIALCSPILFSEDESKLNSEECQKSCGSAVTSTAEIAFNKLSSGNARGEKRFVQKKITECFFKKRTHTDSPESNSTL